MITEDDLEQECLNWFRELDWEVLCGYDIAPGEAGAERDNYKQVILKDRLLAALKKLNPQLPQQCIDDAAHQLINMDMPILVQNNRQFHEFLVNGIQVEYEGSDRTIGEKAKIIDFEDPDNNDFVAINQFTIEGSKRNRRPDIICFVNGLPLVVIELKNPADEKADIWKAFNQLQTYKDEISDLFITNEALIISDGTDARIGSLTASSERFLPWRTINGERETPKGMMELEVLIRGFFQKEYLCDYLRYFIIFEEDGPKIIKKIAAYHQFHAVRLAVASSVEATQVTKSGRCGVVWHTQGSGKSISMSCYAGKLVSHEAMNNPTLVIVTDRNDLDGQLYQTFCNATMLLRQQPQQAESRESLRDLLTNRTSGGIIFTTIQKFGIKDDETAFPVLTDRSNVVIVTDEAHRSQYGLKSRLDDKSGKYKIGYARHMRDAFPNAGFIGFTGTPVSMVDKDTRAVFGDYIHIYDIEQAVNDGATVKIYFESRLAKLELNIDEVPTLDNDFEEIVDEMDEDADFSQKQKSKWAALEALVTAEPRIKQVSQDLVKHFNRRLSAIDGKGMIVCMSRQACVHMYNELIKIKPEWHSDDIMAGEIKVIMTCSASDSEFLRAHDYDKKEKKTLEKRVKDPEDSLKLVIVCDMWLTGFDAPCMHTMYIDKPMKGHNLMQAIARVNRVFKDKPGGLVVDYLGIANELREALHTYTASNGRGQVTVDTDEALAILIEKVEVCRTMMHEFDYSGYKTRALALLAGAADTILGLKDGKKRFSEAVLAMTKAFALCGTMDEAQELKDEVAFLQAVKAVISKDNTGKKHVDAGRIQHAMRQIVSSALISGEVVDVFKAAGLNKPDISILSDEFLEDVKHMPQRNLAVEMLQKLLNNEIKVRSARNVVLQKKYTDMLQTSLLKYQNRSIETAQVIEELIAMAKDFKKSMNRGDELGLDIDELAFYDALEQNEASVRELGDAILKTIAQELAKQLRKSTTVDWAIREAVRAKLRILVKRILKRYKYPPDKQEAAVRMVMKQAEVLSEEWSRS
jgi:type I restriction enzyme R subunit